MTDTGRAAERTPSFPRRDALGRVVNAPEFFGAVLGALLVGVIVLVAIDAILTFAGLGTFGQVSGWLAGIVMVWTLVEQFRAWKGVPGRIGVVLVAAAVGLLAGSLSGGLLTFLPNVFAGAIGVAIAGLIYAALWFYGIRWLAGRVGKR